MRVLDVCHQFVRTSLFLQRRRLVTGRKMLLVRKVLRGRACTHFKRSAF